MDTESKPSYTASEIWKLDALTKNGRNYCNSRYDTCRRVGADSFVAYRHLVFSSITSNPSQDIRQRI
jgi:hypothetical protein